MDPCRLKGRWPHGARDGLGENADPTGPDQQPDDDQYDSPEHLAPEEREDACHDQHHCENPQQKFHGPDLPSVRVAKRAPAIGRRRYRIKSLTPLCRYRSLSSTLPYSHGERTPWVATPVPHPIQGRRRRT